MMRTPYEELEYLANYLPDEGESVVVTRRSGDLVVERPSALEERIRQTHSQESERVSADDVQIDNREFDGRLIQADARLRRLAIMPTWVIWIAAFWLCSAMHLMLASAVAWTLTAGVLLAAALAVSCWVRARRARLFRSEIRAMLAWQLRRCRLDRFATMSKMQGRNELSYLLSEMTRWIEV